MKWAIRSCILFITLLPVAGLGQDITALPKLLPSAVTLYDIDRGLPITCIDEVFIDPKGRLFINPCKDQDIYQSLSFFQYDGNKSNMVTMVSPDGKAGPFGWHLWGNTKGGLLFGTDSKNTYGFLYDPGAETKHLFSFENSGLIRNMVAGSGNEVYVLTYSPGVYSIFRLTRNDKKLLTQISVPGQPEPYFGSIIPAIRSGDQIWFLNANKGFIGYSIKDNQIKQFDWLELSGGTFKEYPAYSSEWTNLNMSLTPDGKPLFYIRAFGGFFVFDPASGQLSQQYQLNAYIKHFKHYPNLYLHFFQDAQKNLLVTIAWIVNPKNSDMFTAVLWDQGGHFLDYQPVSKIITAGRYKNANSGYFQSRDFKKQILVATGGGLIAAEIKANLPIKTGLKGWACRAIGAIDQNRILVLSETGNKAILNLNNMESSVLTHKQSDNPFYAALPYGQLVSKEDLLWFSTGHNQLACYRQADKSFLYYTVGQKFSKFNFIGPQEIAFASAQNEILRYDLANGKLRPFRNDGVALQIEGTVNEIISGKNDILWIASLNGLWRLDPRSSSIKRISKADGLADDRIMCIHEDGSGELWLGTLGSGLQIYNPETGALRSLNQSTGLSNNTVVGILSDNDGDCWISTFEGISVVSKGGKVLFELSEKEGLAHREFNRFSSFKTSDGPLIFGGVDGLTILEPERIKEVFAQADSLQIYMTAIRYFDKSGNKETLLTANFDQLNRIVLPATHRYIKFDFGFSDFTNPEKNTFAYRLKHNNSDEVGDNTGIIWTVIGTRSELLLNDLPVGTYEILIKGTNEKGQETVMPLKIPVRVQEFFYKTWWFYVFCSLPFFLAGFFWIRRLQTERVRLEAEVIARTQQIRLDKELIEEQAIKLQTLDELKSRFFINISHEFRTPLTVISGMATQIRQQPGQWLEKGIEIIQRNSQQLLSLINQILDLRKLESGALNTNIIQGNIIPYLLYISESFIQLANSKGLRIHLLANADKVDMDYDPEKMMHILSNLLSNAIKYTPAPGDIYLQIDRLHNEAGQDQLRIQVRDSGQGIAPEALPYIFDLFYQVEDLATQKPHGSGVGLALTKELVELLKGTIEVSSIPGDGTTFTLKFPITRDAKIQEGQFELKSENFAQTNIPAPVDIEQQEPAVKQQPESTGQPTLLIVEDNADVRLYLTACLESHYQLLLAKDGQEGIEVALEQVPDLIVSDVMMPGKDGYALCETLKNDERSSHIPIVLLTAKADFESRLTGLRRGADAYLAKPFEPAELLVRLEQLLALRAKLQERYRSATLAGSLPGSDTNHTEDAFILKLRQLVLEHLSEDDYGIVHLCRALGLGRTQLHNKIKALTDQSTSEFVRTVRLNKARELLQTTDMNVSEVSYEVGISNPAYFSRIYSEAFGEAPRETRR